MARIIQTADFTGGDYMTRYQVYNGLDSCITVEIAPILRALMDEDARRIYQFNLGMAAPALEMMLRGVDVDMDARHNVSVRLGDELKRAEAVLDRFAQAVWDKPLNPRSPAQLKAFFYETMQLPPVTIWQKGERKISTNRESLEKLSDHFYARPIVACILAIRDLNKKLQFLKSGIDPDNRIRTSYNPGGTETLRWSSNENVWGTGTNLQNVTPAMRSIFIPPPGYKMAYVDLQSAESMGVAKISGDKNYIEACETGDPHTIVTKMMRPDMPWTGNIKEDKKLAGGTIVYRDLSARDLSKKGGHGSNYYGKPPTMAKHTKLPVKVLAQFQADYFRTFPGIPKWHQRVITAIQTQGFLTTALGFKRWFLGRPEDEATWREAIAFEPQSVIAMILNIGLWKVWKYGRALGVLPILQVHDAIVAIYPEEREAEAVAFLIAQLRVPVTVNGERMLIESDAQVGWNWAKYADEKTQAKAREKGLPIPALNLNGLQDWTGKDERKRKQSRFLDRLVS